MVTFLLTDVEGSTRLWEERPAEMAAALAEHDARLAEIMRRHGGELIKSRGEGDATFCVFDDPAGALAAALDAQRALNDGLIRIRIAVHTGAAEARDGDYFGPTVNRCARLKGAAHGGQIVVSLATRQLTTGLLPAGASLRDLGIHRLRDLSEPEQVFQLCHPDVVAEFPPLASLDRRRDNLPASRTSFVGREADVRDLDAALAAAPLVTLVGPGGVGKTRLALEAGRRHVGARASGVWFVDLSSATEPQQVLPAIAAALGVREEPGRSLAATLTANIATHDTLVIVDNCEHLLAAAADAVDLILRAGDQVRVLATSRERLGVSGEQAFPVAPLSVPADTAFDESDAVALFLARAKQADPRFVISASERDAVIRICQALDGLPLALELAAARLDALSVTQIAERLHDRFELLQGGVRTADARQRTLAAAIDWSYDLLDAAPRAAFAALAVFPGDFNLAGADAIVGKSSLATVTALVSKSLLRRVGDRYVMLESVRSYASDRLAASAEGAAVQDRFVDWAEALTAADPDDFDTLEREHANILAAMRAATSGRPDAALAIAAGLHNFWEATAYVSEGRRVLGEVLALAAGAHAAARATALINTAMLAIRQGDWDDAEALLRDGLGLAQEAGVDRLARTAFSGLGHVAHQRGDVEKARLHFESALRISRAMNAPRDIAITLGNLGMLDMATGDLDHAMSTYDEVVALARNVGDEHLLAEVLGNAGQAFEYGGQPGRARGHYEEALVLARRRGDLQGTAGALTKLASLLIEDDPDTAHLHLDESVSLARALGDRLSEGHALYALADLARLGDRLEDARKALDESLVLFREAHYALGEAAVLLDLSSVERRGGATGVASELARQALRMMSDLQYPLGIAQALDELAAQANSRRDFERAAELLGSAASVRSSMGAPEPQGRDLLLDPADVQAALGEQYDVAWERGADDDLPRAVQRGLGLT
jgi:predicted ATPase/class 3 adenylate cyclase/Tfp pilus assembly protein PilF